MVYSLMLCDFSSVSVSWCDVLRQLKSLVDIIAKSGVVKDVRGVRLNVFSGLCSH